MECWHAANKKKKMKSLISIISLTDFWYCSAANRKEKKTNNRKNPAKQKTIIFPGYLKRFIKQRIKGKPLKK